MNESLQGIQRANAQVVKTARNIARPPAEGPQLQTRDTMRDIVDLSQAARSVKANAVVFSVAAEMSETALEIGHRLDQFA